MLKDEKKTDIRKNTSGYSDPTAYAAIKKADRKQSKDYIRFKKLIEAIFAICELSGFHLEGRIVVKDTKTGKIWR